MNKNAKILVTGSAGFIGSHLYDRLFESGHRVYGLDDLSGGYMENVSQKRYFTKLDLRNREATAKYLSKLKPDIIFHLAADATEGRSQFTPFSAVDRNLVAYVNLIVPAIKNGMKKMILTSSMSVYGDQQAPFLESMLPRPEDIYGISKAAMESKTRVFSKVYGFDYVIIRPHNVYGSRQNLADPYRNVIGIFINRLLQGKNFYIYGNGEQKRAFSYIDDIVPPMAKAAFSKKCRGQIINLGSDEAVTINELSEVLLNKFFDGNKVEKKYRPSYLPDRPQEVKYAYCNHDLALKLINFRSKTKLKDGLAKMIAWANKLGPSKFKYLDKLELEHVATPISWKNKLF